MSDDSNSVWGVQQALIRHREFIDSSLDRAIGRACTLLSELAGQLEAAQKELRQEKAKVARLRELIREFNENLRGEDE